MGDVDGTVSDIADINHLRNIIDVKKLPQCTMAAMCLEGEGSGLLNTSRSV